ncbi:MAG: discoidin domain-containing protein [Phycisphaerae bacterium]
MNKSLLTGFQLVALAVLAINCCCTATAADVTLDSNTLKADPWVSPPHTPEQTKERVAELRLQYAAYLRSLPDKLDLRQQQQLHGQWLSHFEVADSADGKRPETPEWFSEDFNDSAWEKTAVPEWRWSPVQKGGRWYPASCILWYRTGFTAEPVRAGHRVFLCFAGVDWEAEVWLNGKFLGRHMVYYEPFRFDVTNLLKKRNILAVRVIDGPAFGEPISQWSLLPFVPGDLGTDQRYVRGDHAKSFPNDKFGTTSSLGSGFGIHREVFLETTGNACVTDVFARVNPSTSHAKVTVETDSVAAKDMTIELRILPENFSGPAYQTTQQVHLPQGLGKQTLSLPMPGARLWWPAEPYLYRCRVILRDGKKLVDSRDVLFGCRSFGIVTPHSPRPGLQEGTFLLNDRPVFLRGTNLSGALNAYWYWNENDKLLEAILMLKAANFNAVRTCQHVSFPEVRELFDRMGIMSEQDQGSGFELGHDVAPTLAKVGTVLARTCYNNPGVVLLSFANETTIDATAAVENAMAVDPNLILVPVSGGTFQMNNSQYRDNVVIDRHPYEAWYGGIHLLWNSARTQQPGRLWTMGEYGAEALDAYKTMRDHYPKQWGPPPKLTEDKLWGSRQVGTGSDLKQQFGARGKTPANLGQYIEASQNYQADVLAESTKGFRLSKQAVSGYFQFHFIDGTAAQWPKAIISHDFLPKKGYYEMAQINQPLVPLYRLVDDGQAMEIWVVNDLSVRLPGCKVHWNIGAGENRIEGDVSVDVPATGTVLGKKIDLKSLPVGCDVLNVALFLSDSHGQRLSSYEREVYRTFKFVPLGKQQAELHAAKMAFNQKTNVALHRPVTATSARDDASAAMAVDGGTRTGWLASDNRLPQSFTVDLGKRTEICGIRLIWQGDATRQVEVHLSDDAEHWQPVSGQVQNAILPVHRPPLIFQDQSLIFGGQGRYMRIAITQVSDGGPAGFNELEVYAKH